MRDFVRQHGGEKRSETFASRCWDVGDLRSEVLKQTQYAGIHDELGPWDGCSILLRVAHDDVTDLQTREPGRTFEL